jgi:hypothetical protein
MRNGLLQHHCLAFSPRCGEGGLNQRRFRGGHTLMENSVMP